MAGLFFKLLRNQRGVALIEFVLVFPVMLLLLFSAIEMSRHIVITQKVETATYALTNIVGQFAPAAINPAPDQISAGALDADVLSQLTRMMGVFGDPSNQKVIISSVIRSKEGTRLLWQRVGGGTLTNGVASIVNGATGNSTPGMECGPAPFTTEDIRTQLSTMSENENMIVGEVFFRYRAILGPLGGLVVGAPEQTITRQVFLHPRSGKLWYLPPTHRVISDTIPPCQ